MQTEEGILVDIKFIVSFNFPLKMNVRGLVVLSKNNNEICFIDYTYVQPFFNCVDESCSFEYILPNVRLFSRDHCQAKVVIS